jgi:hypothetical protein
MKRRIQITRAALGAALLLATVSLVASAGAGGRRARRHRLCRRAYR